MKPVLSPKELALAIGVSESSLKRWADDGLIDVTRTAGGHRRIAIGEAIRFIRNGRFPLVRPEVLGLGDVKRIQPDALRGDAPAEQLFNYLREGRAHETRGLLTSLYVSGESLAAVFDGPLQSSMARLGEIWKHDDAGVFYEHRATDICIQAVQQLRAMLPPNEGGPVAVGGAPSGDPYLLPSLLAATALAAEGFQAVNLGPDTPLESLMTAAAHHKARLVWLSITAKPDGGKLPRALNEMAGRLAARDARLVLGGQNLSESLAPRGENVHVGRSMAELVAFAKGLRAALGSRVGEDGPALRPAVGDGVRDGR